MNAQIFLILRNLAFVKLFQKFNAVLDMVLVFFYRKIQFVRWFNKAPEDRENSINIFYFIQRFINRILSGFVRQQ